VLAVLVVATPCPLILATPAAIIGGITARRADKSYCARAAPRAAKVEVAIFDEDGHAHGWHTTRTTRVVSIDRLAPPTSCLSAASVERLEPLLARTIVRSAETAGLIRPPEISPNRPDAVWKAG
jgi:cation transport ATPase